MYTSLYIQASSACLDWEQEEPNCIARADLDLSYWAEFGEYYQPDNYPITGPISNAAA